MGTRVDTVILGVNYSFKSHVKMARPMMHCELVDLLISVHNNTCAQLSITHTGFTNIDRIPRVHYSLPLQRDCGVCARTCACVCGGVAYLI